MGHLRVILAIFLSPFSFMEFGVCILGNILTNCLKNGDHFRENGLVSVIFWQFLAR